MVKNSKVNTWKNLCSPNLRGCFNCIHQVNYSCTLKGGIYDCIYQGLDSWEWNKK